MIRNVRNKVAFSAKSLKYSKRCDVCDERFFKLQWSSLKEWERRRFCSNKCRGVWVGREQKDKKWDHDNPLKGTGKGWIHKATGYRITHHPFKKGKVKIAVHRLIMEQHLGRSLSSEEHVHHINHDKLDNRIENLRLMTSSDHWREHREGKDNSEMGFNRGKKRKFCRCGKFYFTHPCHK